MNRHFVDGKYIIINLKEILMPLLTYKYRIYPTSKQKIRLINNFKTCKQTYNYILFRQKQIYTECKQSLSKFDMNRLISKSKIVHSQVLQNVSDRVSKAFNAFFGRCKDNTCKRKGYPRFKSCVKSITYPQSGFKFLNERRLKVSKIGNIPIVLHRIMKGQIKTMTIKRNKVDQWFAYFSCEVKQNKQLNGFLPDVGIDVGKQYFTVGSDGKYTKYPFFKEQQQRKLRILHRKVSRKKKGSKNRQKAIHQLNVTYNKITNQREDWTHKLSHYFRKHYSHVAYENLIIQSLLNIGYKINNRRTLDVAWRSFLHKLTYKAVTSEVDCKNTTRKCFKCGEIQDMPPNKRQYDCECGINIHRDLNAAFNILSRAGLARTHTPLDIEPLSFSA